MNKKERLQKFLARAGVASRRKAETLIQDGLVSVNGKTVTEMGVKIDPFSDKVTVKGEPIRMQEKLVYIALNKPKGYITTREDKYAEKTVYDLLPPEYKNILHPVGRLDKDTAGLLIITNDGDLTFELTHPRFGHEKEYEVSCEGKLGKAEIKRLENGIDIEDRVTAKAKVKVIKTDNKSTTLIIIIKEGAKRQIRYMFEAVGHPVLNLRRIREADLKIDDLGIEEGEYLEVALKQIINNR
ncbi:rRNA pseudouridine synthase [Patescibacteria group bacterium]|nr:rRNA pseudouridine synthase [Patescibacteria group bacterium]